MTRSQGVPGRQTRRGLLRVGLAAAGVAALPSFAFLPSSARADGGEVRIGYQKGSSNLLVLKAQNLLPPVLDPLGYTITWTEFQAGPPMLEALNAYLLSRASVNEAQSASAWLVGSLNARGWEHLTPVAVTLAVLGAVLVVLIDDLRVMELGDDNAASLGVHVRRVRFSVLAVVVGFSAVATAVAGPVAFIALTAPPLARLLTRTPGPNLPASALTGALLLTVSDLFAQRLLAPTILPVGVMTGAIGGVYLCFLLFRGSRVSGY